MPELVAKEDAHHWPEIRQESCRNCAEIRLKSNGAVGELRDRGCSRRAGGIGSDVELNTSQKHPELDPTSARRCVLSCILKSNETLLSLP